MEDDERGWRRSTKVMNWWWWRRRMMLRTDEKWWEQQSSKSPILPRHISCVISYRGIPPFFDRRERGNKPIERLPRNQRLWAGSSSCPSERRRERVRTKRRGHPRTSPSHFEDTNVKQVILIIAHSFKATRSSFDITWLFRGFKCQTIKTIFLL